MSTHNVCFHGEIRKILCGYPLLSVAISKIQSTGKYWENTGLTRILVGSTDDTGSYLNQSQQLPSALSPACDFKSHFCKQEQSDLGPHCLPVCKNRFEKFARIFSRRHKQVTFSDADFLGALRVNTTRTIIFYLYYTFTFTMRKNEDIFFYFNWGKNIKFKRIRPLSSGNTNQNMR